MLDIRLTTPPSRLPLTLLVMAVVGGLACSDSGLVPPPELTGDSPGETETLLRQALTRTPGDPELLLYLAGNLADQGKVSEAAATFDEAGEDPAWAGRVARERHRVVDSYRNRAASHMDAGQLAEARVDLTQAVTLAPNEGETLYLQGRLEEMEGNGSKALERYRRAWEAEPRDRVRRDALLRLLMRGARAATEDGEYSLAWERLGEAENVQPNAPDVAYLRGMVSYAWAQQTEGEAAQAYLEDAASAFRQVLETDPGDEDARFNLGAVLLAQGEWTEAVGIYEDLIRADRTDGRLYLALSRAHGLGGADSIAVALEAVGRGLRTEDPVQDPELWARRAAERFPTTDLARAYQEHGAPQAVYTYVLPGGDLVEVWLYWGPGLAHAFREGARLGSPVALPR